MPTMHKCAYSKKQFILHSPLLRNCFFLSRIWNSFDKTFSEQQSQRKIYSDAFLSAIPERTFSTVQSHTLYTSFDHLLLITTIHYHTTCGSYKKTQTKRFTYWRDPQALQFKTKNPTERPAQQMRRQKFNVTKGGRMHEYWNLRDRGREHARLSAEYGSRAWNAS